ncbi:hypothetical protein [Streptomyces lacrimifluminis]|uniref:hypothetical protein n=1 Tax=Streptomyces lacrimifluminis TaxID=1500077 RepID=UPI001667DC7B|nr:hypothetical protein [Streptomyces lacrimifluminis]
MISTAAHVYPVVPNSSSADCCGWNRPCSYASTVLTIVAPSAAQANGLPSARGAARLALGFAAVFSFAVFVVPGFATGFSASLLPEQAVAAASSRATVKVLVLMSVRMVSPGRACGGGHHARRAASGERRAASGERRAASGERVAAVAVS